MKIIKLTKGYETEVDDEDFVLLSKYNWCVKVDKNTCYAVSAEYDPVFQTSERVYMHCLIMGSKEIDHRDGNGLNNKRNNLRRCTRSQNLMNISTIKGSVNYKGVSENKRDRKYRARIFVNNKQKFLGNYNSPIDAAKAYDKAALRYFGEFAKTNKMLGLI